VAAFLLAARNEIQKVGVAPLRRQGQILEKHAGGRHYCFPRDGFVSLESGVAIAKGDAAVLSRQHLINLAGLVGRAYTSLA
jgi:hypothetical protein